MASAGDAAAALVARHHLTLLWVLPDLRAEFPVPDELAQFFALVQEGQPLSWTRRLAHGLTEFLLDHVARSDPARCCISFDNVDQADSLDREFMAVLLRRADPGQLRVRVLTASDRLDEPLAGALGAHARLRRPRPPRGMRGIPACLRSKVPLWRAEWAALGELVAHTRVPLVRRPSRSFTEFLADAPARLPPAARRKLAAEFVDRDCASGGLLARSAYAGFPPAQRRRLHRGRALRLTALNQPSLTLGAVPFHHERAGASVEPLLAASQHCFLMAFFAAAFDWAGRGLAMLDPLDRSRTYRELTRIKLFALLLLGRLGDVEALCAEIRNESTDPALLIHACYALAVLNLRYYDPAHRDLAAAAALVEEARGLTERLVESPRQVANLAFLWNTQALVEMRASRADAALGLLNRALGSLAAETSDRYARERALFLYHRGRLHGMAGRLDQAVADLSAHLLYQPGESEVYYERAVIHQRLGRNEEALRDFDAAIKWSPPYAAPHLGRALILAAQGRSEEAIAEYDYVLVLEPEHLEALANRAWLRYQAGAFDAARADADVTLRLQPGNPRALCQQGLIAMKRGQADHAYASFTAAIAADPAFVQAWASRATILFRRGEFEAALADLGRALDLREDASYLYNRGRVHEARRDWALAEADYTRALALRGDAAPHILRHRALCRRETGIS